jgi:hypothetical protein
VGRIAEAIEMVDADVNACTTAIDKIVETIQELDAKALRIPFSNVCIVQNNCIIPKSTFAKYRLFISEDSLITFDWSQIVIEKDSGFDLEIISDGTYVISFDANIVWTLPCAGVLAGKTVIHFERKFGSTILYGELKNTETKSILNLTPNSSEDIQLFIKTVQDGGDHAAFSTINFGTAQREYKRELNAYRTLTPIMNANSQDGFVLMANSIYSGQEVYSPFEAFNRTVSDASSWTTKTQSGWIQVELPQADVANMLQMSGGFSTEEPDSFVLSGSNNGENYIELLNSGPLTWTHNETKTWEFENETAYKFYKIDAGNTKSAYITISEIKLIEHQMIKEY